MSKKKYTVKNHDETYCNELTGEVIQSDKNISGYRVKEIKSGDIFECEIYPLFRKRTNTYRSSKNKESRETQKNLNNKNTRKRISRLINANFTEKDIWIHLGYDNKHLPKTEDEAQKNIRNYLRRVKTYCQKQGLPKLKYIYVTEFSEDEKRKIRIHHHVIMNFTDRDMAEQLWQNGNRPQARRLQPDDFGLEGMARYITKDPKGSKSYGCSKGLEQPEVAVFDTKLRKRKAESLAFNENVAIDWCEEQYKEYKFTSINTYISEEFPGVYVYLKMKRKRRKEEEICKKR